MATCLDGDRRRLTRGWPGLDQGGAKVSHGGWVRMLDRGARWAVILPAFGTFLVGAAKLLGEPTRLAPVGQGALIGLGGLLVIVAVLLLRSVAGLRLELLVVGVTALLLTGFAVGKVQAGWMAEWWPTSVTVLALCWVVGFGSRYRLWVGGGALLLFGIVRWWSARAGGASWYAGVADGVVTTQLVLSVVLGMTAARRAAVRSDQAELERLAAVEEEARQGLSAVQARQVARFLHDDVSHTLRAVALADRLDETSVRQLAAQTMRRLASGDLNDEVGSGPEPDLFPRLACLDGTTGVRVRVTGRAPHLPDEVVDALVAAAAEALRNVARHAGTDQAVIRVRAARDGVVVSVIDQGRGLPPGTRPGVGIKESVIGRMEDVGGSARVHSWRRGTTVDLRWSAEAAARVADTWRELTKALTPMVIPGVIAAVTLGLLVLPDVAHPVWAAASLLLFAACGAWIVIQGVWLTPRRSYAFLVTAGIVCFALNVMAVAPDTTDGYHLFLAGGVSYLIVLVAIQHRLGWSLLAVALVWGAMLVLGILRFGVEAVTGPLAAAFCAPFIVLGILLPRAVMDRVVRRTMDARDQTARSRKRAASLHRRQDEEDARLQRTRARVEPFLHAVVDTQVDLGDPAVLRQALRLESMVRDELRFGVDNDAFAHIVNQARERGWQVEIRVRPQQRTQVTEATAVLLSALGPHDPDSGTAFLSSFGEPALVVREPTPAQMQRWRNRPDIEVEEGKRWCRMTVRAIPRTTESLLMPVRQPDQTLVRR